MPNDQLSGLFSKLSNSSLSYSISASRLSDGIQSIQKRLNALLGKVAVDVESEGSPKIWLSFDRIKSASQWALWIQEEPFNNEQWSRLTEASIKLKIKAIPLFEPLLIGFLETQAQRRKEVDKAIDLFSPILEGIEAIEKEDA